MHAVEGGATKENKRRKVRDRSTASVDPKQKHHVYVYSVGAIQYNTIHTSIHFKKQCIHIQRNKREYESIVPISFLQARTRQQILCQWGGLFAELSILARFRDAAAVEAGTKKGKGRFGIINININIILPLVFVFFQSIQEECAILVGSGGGFRRDHGLGKNKDCWFCFALSAELGWVLGSCVLGNVNFVCLRSCVVFECVFVSLWDLNFKHGFTHFWWKIERRKKRSKNIFSGILKKKEFSDNKISVFLLCPYWLRYVITFNVSSLKKNASCAKNKPPNNYYRTASVSFFFSSPKLSRPDKK